MFSDDIRVLGIDMGGAPWVVAGRDVRGRTVSYGDDPWSTRGETWLVAGKKANEPSATHRTFVIPAETVMVAP